MRRTGGGLAVWALALGSFGLLAAWPVSAAWPIPFPGDPPVPCRFELHDTADPGWLMTPSRGTASATGTMSCTGQLKGAQLSGAPGPFTTRFLYDSNEVAGGNTCALAAGRGTWAVKLPTADGGLLDLSGSFTWVGTQVGRMDGDLGRLPVTLGYGAYPDPAHTDEDCVTKPASHIGMIGQGTLGYATPV